MSSKKLGFLNNLSKPFVKLVENFYPDAFIFVIVLSVLTFLLAVLNTDSTIIEPLRHGEQVFLNYSLSQRKSV